MALADTARLIASLELQDKFSGPASRVDRSIGGLERSTSRLNNVGASASRGLSSLGANLTKIAAIGVGVAGVIGIKSVQAASDLNEEIDKSRVVFGKASEEVIAFAEGAAQIGLAKAEALGAAGAFGNMFRTTGLAEGEAADMSTTMVQLAADMASFNNEDPSDMLDRLRSGLSGEAEPLRRFGVLLSEATVKEFAYRKGIAETGEALTEAQKVQARYGLILEQTELQQGNFADTSGSLANQQRKLNANLQNTAAVIGQALLPSVAKVAKAINEAFVRNQPAIERFGEKLGGFLEGLFTDQNINRGIDKVSGFIDKLSKGGEFEGASDGFSAIVGQVARLPWQAIGDAAKLLGTGSKALLDAFLSLPPWVQTAVLTGWGLNKLTGGALGSIVSELGKGLIKGVLNMNAAVVNVNAKAVTGGPGGGLPTGGRGGGGFLGSLGRGLAVGTGVGLAATAGVMTVEFVGKSSQQLSGIQGSLDNLDRKTVPEIYDSLEKVENAQKAANKDIVSTLVSNATGLNNRLETEADQLRGEVHTLNAQEGQRHSQTLAGARDAAARQVAAVQRANQDEGRRAAATHARLQDIRNQEAAANSKLEIIKNKRTSFRATVNVNTTTNVEFSTTAAAIQLRRVTQSTGNQQDFEMVG